MARPKGKKNNKKTTPKVVKSEEKKEEVLSPIPVEDNDINLDIISVQEEEVDNDVDIDDVTLDEDDIDLEEEFILEEYNENDYTDKITTSELSPLEEEELIKKGMVIQVIKDLDQLMTVKYDDELIIEIDNDKSKEEQVADFNKLNDDTSEGTMVYLHKFNEIYLTYPEIAMSLYEFNIKFSYFLRSRNLYIEGITERQIRKFIRYQSTYDTYLILSEMGYLKK